jgi:hypothetical protein
MRPKLLCYLLDTLAKALQIKSTIVLSSLPRPINTLLDMNNPIPVPPDEFVTNFETSFGK